MFRIKAFPRIHITLIGMNRDGYRLNGGIGFSISSPTFDISFEEADSIDIIDHRKQGFTVDELHRLKCHINQVAKNKNFENALGKLLPSKIITAVINKSGIDPAKKVNSVTKQEREKLCRTLKDFEVKISGNRGFLEAIITRGGVDTGDINPSTMESKKIKGLYFAGEMIDVDALTGGFNLQIAWSTGYLSGICCKEEN